MKLALVIDDHPIVLHGICNILRQKGFEAIGATSAEEALLAIKLSDSINLIVCDLQLKEPGDGLELLEQIRILGKRCPTVMYTLHDEPWNINRLMEADIEGIVLKGDNISELIQAIETVSNGKRYLSESYDKSRLETLKINGILSAKSLEILKLLAKGLTTTQIADSVCLSSKAVEYHRGIILHKLHCNTTGEAIARALKLGYIVQ